VSSRGTRDLVVSSPLLASYDEIPPPRASG
jgi:hypothetical protein